MGLVRWGGVITARIAGLFPEVQPVLTQSPKTSAQIKQLLVQLDGAEHYAGFLLLPENARVPSFVRPGRSINLHGHGALAGESVQFDSIDELKSYVPFPIYVPTQLPSGVQLVDATVIQYRQSGNIWAARTSYGTNSTEGNTVEPLISLWAQPEHPNPYPIWPVRDLDSLDEDIIYPEKVSFSSLPPGILRPSASGHLLQWMHQNIHYMLVAEHDPAREAVEVLASALTQV